MGRAFMLPDHNPKAVSTRALGGLGATSHSALGALRFCRGMPYLWEIRAARRTLGDVTALK